MNATGHPVDLPGAIREKFENAFGADLSAVRLYRSQAVADAGARAVTMGEKVAFAPGMLNFSSREGLTLLGHEMSHVVSQQRGEVTGSGFLNDPALEAKADREGAMAAAGQEISAPTAALSTASAGSASGPMQASKNITNMALNYGIGNTPPVGSHYSGTYATGTNNAFRAQGNPAAPASDASKNVKHGNDYVKSLQGPAAAAAKFADTHYARVDEDQLTKGPWGGHWSPILSAATGGLGFLSGGMTAYTSGASTIRNYKNLNEGTSKWDVAEDALSTLGGVGTMGMGGVTFMKGVSSGFASMLAKGGSLSTLLPWLSIGTGAANAGAGLIQAVRSGKRWNEISVQLNTLGTAGLSPDQARMRLTMEHGLKIQRRNTLLGTLKTISGGLTAAGGALTMGGATSPLGLGLSAAGALVNGIGSIYNLLRNRRLRRDAIAQEYGGVDYLGAIQSVRNHFNNQYISRGNAWKIFLQSNAIADEKTKYDDIRKRRAAHMLQMAANGDGTAADFIESMGVHSISMNRAGNKIFSQAALDLLAEKLK